MYTLSKPLLADQWREGERAGERGAVERRARWEVVLCGRGLCSTLYVPLTAPMHPPTHTHTYTHTHTHTHTHIHTHKDTSWLASI